MTQTSDERHEIAERLRDGGIARNVEEAYTLILSCVGIRPQLPAETTYTDAMARLADLIDPTCKRIKKISDTGYWWECSKCGGWFVDGFSEEYCPKCGARIVEEK